jgi:hypothetical protein
VSEDRLVADILPKEKFPIMDVDRRSAHDIAANLVKPINSQTSKYRQNTKPIEFSRSIFKKTIKTWKK